MPDTSSTTLIVLAHPERGSFNAAWAEASRRAEAASGREVLFTDLYADGFAPVDPARGGDPAPEEVALSPDLEAEVAKLEAAHRVILHFPLWWFGPPAMLRGWLERALVHGRIYSSRRRFDRGRFRGRRVLMCVTTGAPEAECGPDGREGDTRLLLWPLALTLRYVGYDVIQPMILHGVHGHHDAPAQAALEARLGDVLASQRGVVSEWETLPLIPFNADADFDDEGRLRPGAKSFSPFIRRPGE